ncbi:MAG: NAD(P)-dependent alcohol dehydrogenase [Colwellia sp.]|nr:NAD(P)-dependent alcohol dehydrogenase [Colwellia sp.]
MKAIICTKYGSPDVLQLQESEKPTPKENEVLVKIVAASITTADTMMRQGTPYIGRLFIGLSKPKYPITGTGFAGVIEAVGDKVTLFNVGDQVFGESVFSSGSNAEYLCIAEDGMIAPKPNNITYEQAAPLCDGALTSLHFLRNVGKLQQGEHILINGASGSLGCAAIQIAKRLGAQVTAVCSANNAEMVRSLGADKTIDYTKTDFTKNGQRYDVIYDTVGKRTFADCKRSLLKTGRFISPVLSCQLLIQMLKTSFIGSKKAKFSATGTLPLPELRLLLDELTLLIKNETVSTVIDKCYTMDEVSKAHQYIEQGHKKGNLVLVL